MKFIQTVIFQKSLRASTVLPERQTSAAAASFHSAPSLASLLLSIHPPPFLNHSCTSPLFSYAALDLHLHPLLPYKDFILGFSAPSLPRLIPFSAFLFVSSSHPNPVHLHLRALFLASLNLSLISVSSLKASCCRWRKKKDTKRQWRVSMRPIISTLCLDGPSQVQFKCCGLHQIRI